MHVSDQKDGNCWPLLSLAQTVVWQDQERSSLTRRCAPFSACSWLHVLGREKERPAGGRAPAFSGVCKGQHQGNQHITTESVAKTTTLDKNPFSFLRFHHIPSSYCSDPSFHNTHLYIFHPNHKVGSEGPNIMGHHLAILSSFPDSRKVCCGKCTNDGDDDDKIDGIAAFLWQIIVSQEPSEHFLLSQRQKTHFII